MYSQGRRPGYWIAPTFGVVPVTPTLAPQVASLVASLVSPAWVDRVSQQLVVDAPHPVVEGLPQWRRPARRGVRPGLFDTSGARDDRRDLVVLPEPGDGGLCTGQALGGVLVHEAAEGARRAQPRLVVDPGE